MCCFEEDLKGESVVEAVLPSHLEVTFCTSRVSCLSHVDFCHARMVVMVQLIIIHNLFTLF